MESEVEIEPPLPHRITVHPNRAQLNVVPVRPASDDGPFQVSIRARYALGDRTDEVAGAFRARRAPRPPAPSIEELPARPFKITHMAVFDPTVVPSFDQIGIASLTVYARVVHVDPERGKAVFWGLQKFGMDDGGEAVQIAVPRHLYWAMDGVYDEGRCSMTVQGCNFELTSFPVPLDELRLSGTWDGVAGPVLGTSLVAEVDVVSRFRILRRLFGGGDDERKVQRSATPVPWSRLLAFAQAWIPDLKAIRGSLPLVLRSLTRTLPLALRVPRRKLWGPWGLIGEDGWFRGAGNFRSSADETACDPTVEVERLEFDPRRNRITAEIQATGDSAEAFGGLVPGILVVDTDLAEPLRLGYDGATTIRRDAENKRWSVELALPRSFDPAARAWRAYLLLDTTPIGELEVDGSSA